MFLASSILIGSLIQLICAGMIWPDRLQRSLALFVSFYRHMKQIKAGTEPPRRPTPAAGLTISEPIPKIPPPSRVPRRKS